jgi:hypothetical protein
MRRDRRREFLEPRFWITVAVETTIADRPPAQIRTSASTRTALIVDEWRQNGHHDKDAEYGSFHRTAWPRGFDQASDNPVLLHDLWLTKPKAEPE